MSFEPHQSQVPAYKHGPESQRNIIYFVLWRGLNKRVEMQSQFYSEVVVKQAYQSTAGCGMEGNRDCLILSVFPRPPHLQD